MRFVLLLSAPLALISVGCFLPVDEEHGGGEPDEPAELTERSAQALTATRDDNMAMGNPSGALADGSNPNNYLMVKPQYTLSYNNSRGTANWVSWHLSSAWKGDAPRADTFNADALLPAGWIKVYTGWYTSSGFDRGHMCPSDDRDASTTDNEATFLMTNIQPQAPDNNRITWKALEDYARTLMSADNELYIIAGSSGKGGTGSSGAKTTLHSGDVTVPAHFWKVLVVLPVGPDDVSRVNAATRVIAVKMPNTQTVDTKPWHSYRVSVDSLETLTGYNFLSNVPAAVQSTIEAVVDSVAP
jgi:endonuclease G